MFERDRETEARTERQGVDFMNILSTAFMSVLSQSVRTQSSRRYIFTLLGSMSIKAVCRTLMKLSQREKMKEKEEEADKEKDRKTVRESNSDRERQRE